MSHSRTSAAWSLNLETWSSSSASNRSTISLKVLPLTTDGAGSGAALTFAAVVVGAAAPLGAGTAGVELAAAAPPSREGTAGADDALDAVVVAGFAPRLPKSEAGPGLGAVGASAVFAASSFAGAGAVGMLKRLVVVLGASFGVEEAAAVLASAVFAGSAGFAPKPPKRPPAGG